MKFCPQCGAQLDDGAAVCPACGKDLYGKGTGNYDHTAEFTAEDVSNNKAYAMLIYLMGVVGIIIALLASGQSRYLQFHIRQAIKFEVVTALLGIIAAVLAITVVVPIAAGICIAIIFVLKIISFFRICGGKSVEPEIIRSLDFLR